MDATTWLADRAFGKPLRQARVDVNDNGESVRDEPARLFTFDELLAMRNREVASERALPEAEVIDGGMRDPAQALKALTAANHVRPRAGHDYWHDGLIECLLPPRLEAVSARLHLLSGHIYNWASLGRRVEASHADCTRLRPTAA
jgi:hypothetical protein